jgi:hypothetical protein
LSFRLEFAGKIVFPGAMPTRIRIRPALTEDVPVLRALIEASVRGLQAQDYTPAQLESALKSVYGVDSQLIADGTYYVAEADSPDACSAAVKSPEAKPTERKFAETRVPETKVSPPRPVIVGCGGWSKRKTLYGGDHWTGREDSLLDPVYDPAKIRAFFIHPAWARLGIGSMILETCEMAAKSEGFTRLEMGATLTGVPFYEVKGYVALEHLAVPLADGESLPIVRMAKTI